jgi:hypothetical protein
VPIDWTAVAAVAAATGSAIGGLGAWRAAVNLAHIETERTHRDLTPEFSFHLNEKEQVLTVALVGPPGLEALDEVSIRILDEAGKDHYAHGLPEGYEDEARGLVWGPWEFNTGASAQVMDRRTRIPRLFSRVDGRNWDRLSLRRTRPGTWMTGTTERAWREQVAGPMRLALTCAHAGHQPWHLLYEITANNPDAIE